jgi:hypothetical protein
MSEQYPARSGFAWRVALASLLVWFGAMVAVPSVSAQGARASTIHGIVIDSTGGALPGVTVTLTSPALQVREIVAVTEGDGAYRFGDLPAGMFKITFELPGFNTFIRDDLRLTIGFTARVDATMTVGAVQEAVTVSGASPVVDLTSSGTASNFTEEVLETVPRGRDLWSVVDMAPGVSRDGAPDIGGSRMASRPDMATYGVVAQPKLEVEGINITTGGDPQSAVYFNYFGFEEVQFKTSGTDAEVGTPGLHMVAVLKSGGNDFHGRYQGSYQGPRVQSENLDDELRAQGLSDTEPLKYHFDFAADLGGRIIRDKLWFYGGYNTQNRRSSLLGFVSAPGPDGAYLSGDEPLADYDNTLYGYNLKISYQMSRNNRLIGVYQKGVKTQPQNGAGRFRPLEATRDYYDPTWVKKGEWQSTINDRMLINVVGGYGGYFADYSAPRAGFANRNTPSRLDRDTGLRTGGHEASDQRPRDNWQFDGSFSYFPQWSFGGRHELKTGGTMYRQLHGTGLLNHEHGNYVLVYDRVPGFATNQPVEMQINSYPVVPRNRVNTFAWYVKDTWRVTDRLTFNLGLRYEKQRPFIPAQSKEASPQFPQLFPAGDFAEVDLLSWNRFLPRFGVSWSLDNSSVVKLSAGTYNYLFNDADAGLYNLNALQTATFRWFDPDRNGNYTPGEVNLDLNGQDFISISSPANRRFNDDLVQPMTTEVTASYERELVANLGVRVGYVFRLRDNYYDTPGPNELRPRSVYNIPLARRDPGPDGLLNTGDDGGSVTIYDYDPAYRGAAFVRNAIVNSPNSDRIHTTEFALTKRLSNRWMASSSFWMVNNHVWIERTFESPNNDYFPLDETWDWGANLSGLYQLPGNVQISGFLQSKSGVKGQRTYVFRAVDPDGGPPLRQLSTVTLRLEPFGSQRAPAMTNINLRVSKDFRLGHGQSIGFDVDVFNLLNAATPSAVTWVSGPTFGYATQVLPARVMRFGGRYSF